MSWFCRRILPMLALGAVLAGCNFLTPDSAPDALIPPSNAKPALPLSGEDLNGQPMELAEFRGKVVMLSFWATWCPPCMQLVPHERDIFNRYQNKPFVLVGVSLDQKGPDLEKARHKHDSGEMPWRSFQDRGQALSQSYQVNGIPRVILIDPKGNVRYDSGAGVDPKKLDKALDQLIAEAETGR